ncbi:MAG: 6-phosphofructokinase [Acidobacteria bacterium]|nr:MAG: 6-phosphofructokinase [Acidobacteriota bacterium]REK07941.1 MAG: 6-phosphofructokinase [Acidobacteriota bacterium]
MGRDQSPASIRRIGITTGGGDAPGLNAVIRAATLAALHRGWEVTGILRGYAGLFDTSQTMSLDRQAVRGIAHLGGTILGSQSRGRPFTVYEERADGGRVEHDRTPEALAGYRALGLDALIAVGGDGSMQLAHHLSQHGVRVVGVPKTIDNDLSGTVVTFGFDTAVSVATEAVDRLHTTAASHERVFVIELMGRYAGWIALHAGLAGGADVILLPEIPYREESIYEKIREREARGRHFSIVVAAEGARPVGGEVTRVEEGGAPGANVRLGGIAKRLERQIQENTGKETRSLVLGHLQRGGWPTARDRVLSLRFGAAAVRALEAGESGVMVAVDPPDVRTVSLAEATSRMKCVPVDGDTVRSARDLGICLGD